MSVIEVQRGAGSAAPVAAVVAFREALAALDVEVLSDHERVALVAELDCVKGAAAACQARATDALRQSREHVAPQDVARSVGSEVALALAAQQQLAAEGIGVRVVSMPSMEVFARQPKTYQEEVLPAACTKRVSIEAGVTLSWGRHVGTAGKAIGTDTFGLSAPGDVVMKELGITKEAVVEIGRAHV